MRPQAEEQHAAVLNERDAAVAEVKRLSTELGHGGADLESCRAEVVRLSSEIADNRKTLEAALRDLGVTLGENQSLHSLVAGLKEQSRKQADELEEHKTSLESALTDLGVIVEENTSLKVSTLVTPSALAQSALSSPRLS